ncbi:MAG: recombinase family protein [Desulfovibrio sp.]|nr:recombinase family protein [Desulfovibrio sp.]
MIYGYARVSTRLQATDGNSLEAQRVALEAAGAEKVFQEVCTGSTTRRPQLEKLVGLLEAGDTLMVTKLDRFARSAREGLELIDEVNAKGVCVRILNMGAIDDTAIGKLLRTMMLGFAEFERDMIVERTQEGRRIARQKPGYRDGRPFKFTEAQMGHALSLLGEHSYSQVRRLTGISVSTLKRHKRRAAAAC